ncbi:MAG: 2-amino-4-hydroxy-6-hydroxymethyldihydropteridine diphosphokinase [Rhodothermales bacterium]|nr:2-amino-4-hydroxy-6-hydroxymethyldihydropteridine diphosphokinase [Rhodothermales bacterium]
MHTAYIALGSNLGNRADHLRGAVRRLSKTASTRVRAASPVYETEAVTLDGSGGPAYLNAVIHVETQLEPGELLARCLEIERTAGRVRRPGQRWEARSLDLDILVFDDLRIETDDLVVPHPRMSERPFVLQPLADLAPGLHLPEPYDVSVRYLLDRRPIRSKLRALDIQLLDEPGDGQSDRQ